MGKICIFTGHREIPAHTEPLRDALLRHITSLYADGCTDFLCGGAKGLIFWRPKPCWNCGPSCPMCA
jgi:hypothetical protein